MTGSAKVSVLVSLGPILSSPRANSTYAAMEIARANTAIRIATPRATQNSGSIPDRPRRYPYLRRVPVLLRL